jgi:hypothetical protein
MAVKPYTVLATCTVRGVTISRGSVVGLDPAGELWSEYGGAGNLAPLAGDETGDDADHSSLSN